MVPGSRLRVAFAVLVLSSAAVLVGRYASAHLDAGGMRGDATVGGALALLSGVPLWAAVEWRRADLAVELQSPLGVYRR